MADTPFPDKGPGIRVNANKDEPIRLSIFRRGDVLALDLNEEKTLAPKSEITVEQEFLDSLQLRITQLVDFSNKWQGVTSGEPADEFPASHRILNELKSLGQVMYDQLLTDAVKKRLSTASACDLFLKTDDSLVSIPWELLFDGQTFLCQKFRIGRQVATEIDISRGAVERGFHIPLRMLIISDPTEDLEGARVECETICEELGKLKQFRVTMLGGSRVDKIWLLGNIGKFDIVHYAGHAYYDEKQPGRSGWLLADGNLTASEMSNISNPPILVFSNACQSGTSSEWKAHYHYEGKAFGVGSGFLLAGVQNYIGPFWVVHDKPSTTFALSFYSSLLNGSTFGEALQTARQVVIQQYGWEEIVWAGHILYGNPGTRCLPVRQAGGGVKAGTPLVVSAGYGKEKESSLRRSGARHMWKTVLVVTAAVLVVVAGINYEGWLPKSRVILNRLLGEKVPVAEDTDGRAVAPIVEAPDVLVSITERVDDEISSARFVQSDLEQTLIEKGISVVGPSYLQAIPGTDVKRANGEPLPLEELCRMAHEKGIERVLVGTAHARFLRTEKLGQTSFHIYGTDLSLKLASAATGEILWTDTAHAEKGSRSKQSAVIASLEVAFGQLALPLTNNFSSENQ